VGVAVGSLAVGVAVGVALGLLFDLDALEDGLADADAEGDLDEPADLVGPGVLVGAGVVGAVEVEELLPEFEFECTVPGDATGVGRTRTYSASTPRKSAARTRVEVRGRRRVTGSPRSPDRYRPRPRR
jgi:hypothetical protein